MPKRIPISTAKEVAKKHDLQQCLLIGWDGERVHVVTYGKTAADCALAAKLKISGPAKFANFHLKAIDIRKPCCTVGARAGATGD